MGLWTNLIREAATEADFVAMIWLPFNASFSLEANHRLSILESVSSASDGRRLLQALLRVAWRAVASACQRLVRQRCSEPRDSVAGKPCCKPAAGGKPSTAAALSHTHGFPWRFQWPTGVH